MLKHLMGSAAVLVAMSSASLAQSPEVTVEQCAPKVTVTQKDPKLTVTIPEGGGESQLVVEQDDPEVTVEPCTPKVIVAGAEVEVPAATVEPDVTINRAQNAEVTVNRVGAEAPATDAATETPPSPEAVPPAAVAGDAPAPPAADDTVAPPPPPAPAEGEAPAAIPPAAPVPMVPAPGSAEADASPATAIDAPPPADGEPAPDVARPETPVDVNNLPATPPHPAQVEPQSASSATPVAPAEATDADTVEPAAAASTTDAEAVSDVATEPASTDAAAVQTAPVLASDVVVREGYELAPVDVVRGDELKGAGVYTADDQKIGNVEDIVAEADGKITQVIVGVGGFLGVGERKVAWPFDQVSLQRKADGSDLRAYVGTSGEQVNDLPEYNPAN